MSSKKAVKGRQKHIPQRTCVACRRQFDKRQITRIVRTPDEGVVLDPTGKRSGRGAYLCDQPECWEKALGKPRLLSQALNTELSMAELAMLSAHRPAANEVESSEARVSLVTP